MEKGDMQPILRCGQCNKPFDKQATLKRHGYYCRSRNSGSSTRYRSCICCAKGKARCDNKRPNCSRCLTRGIECQYPNNLVKGSKSKPQTGKNLSNESACPSVVDSPHIVIRQNANIDGDMTLDDTLVTQDLDFGDLGGENLGWDDTSLDFSSFLNLQTIEGMAQYPSWDSTLASPRIDQIFQFEQPVSPKNLVPIAPWTTPNDHIFQLPQFKSAPKSMIPTMPTSAIRTLNFRPRMEPSTQKIATLILQTLKSYPLMLLHHNSLPPFIHPSLIGPNVENPDMELLSTCLNLVHMTGSNLQGSKKLFWKNVRMECEFMLEENTRFNRWQLLAALQALSIYILMRLCEGETIHNNLDILLIRAVMVISSHFAPATICTSCNTQSHLCHCNLATSWQEWIFQESGRRMCMVYQVMNMLVYFEPANMCEMPATKLLLAPLPAKKRLWEAGDGYAWKTEYDREAGDIRDFGLATNGNLVRLDDVQINCGDDVVARTTSGAEGSGENWEEWCAGMDGFGGLVMLAASMVV